METDARRNMDGRDLRSCGGVVGRGLLPLSSILKSPEEENRFLLRAEGSDTGGALGAVCVGVLASSGDLP